MLRYTTLITLFLMIVLVLIRVAVLRHKGIKAMRFGEMDKKDFIIMPFVLFYAYLLIASVFGLPKFGEELFENGIAAWCGTALCILSLILFISAIISFGKNFRVGLDEEHPGKLVTTGAFAISRNPIYTAFGGVVSGIFLIIPNWIFIFYIIAGFYNIVLVKFIRGNTC